MKGVVRGLALCLVPAAALAAAPLAMDRVAGVYKTRFPNGLVDGTQFTSENVLEVVKISADRAYVRAELQFFNGHVCSVAAVFHPEGDSLVWRHQTVMNKACELRLTFADGTVAFHDKDGNCRQEDCGARGAFDGVSFPAASRRAIRYMPRLLASREYGEALKAAGP